MSKPRILVTRRLPQAVEQLIRQHFDALFNPEDTILPASRIVELAHQHQAQGLLITLTDRLDAETIARLPDNLGVISTFSVGHNHVDGQACKARGIQFGFAPEATTRPTADVALFLILATLRRAHEYQMQLRQGQWAGWTAWKDLGFNPNGKVLGLAGMGRIGQAVAHRARAFDMEIHYFQRTRLSPEQEQGAVYHDSLKSLFMASDILSLHTPSTPATIGMINQESLSWLKKGSIFINTARGDQVVDDALIACLQNGHLFAAGLDVFAGEPKFDPRYLDLPNAYLLPHIGTSTTETRDQMGRDALDNLIAFFQGKPLPWPVS